jgi:hypothetical protein
MRIKTDMIVKKLKKTVKEWDADFNQFQIKAYPNRLLAQVQYREQLNSLISMRLLVEEKLLNFDRHVKA